MQNNQKLYQVLADSVVVTDKPEMIAEATTEFLFGEQLEVIGRDDDEWVKVRSIRDGYEGYVPRGELDDEIHKPTHKISGLRGFGYTESDYKSSQRQRRCFLVRPIFGAGVRLLGLIVLRLFSLA